MPPDGTQWRRPIVPGIPASGRMKVVVVREVSPCTDSLAPRRLTVCRPDGAGMTSGSTATMRGQSWITFDHAPFLNHSMLTGSRSRKPSTTARPGSTGICARKA